MDPGLGVPTLCGHLTFEGLKTLAGGKGANLKALQGWGVAHVFGSIPNTHTIGGVLLRRQRVGALGLETIF